MAQESFVPWHYSCQLLKVVTLFVLKKCNCKFIRLSFKTAWVRRNNKEGKKWQTGKKIRAVRIKAAKKPVVDRVAANRVAVSKAAVSRAAAVVARVVAAKAADKAAAAVAVGAIVNRQSLNN